MLKAIEALGYEQPSPIQAEAIPPALAGRDVVGQSQTGSGKTMAFGIPALELIDPKVKKVQVLILCPTRELAIQVCTEIHKITTAVEGARVTPIYGGAAFDRQIRALNQGTQIVIGTPGRVLDFIRRGVLKLDVLKMLVFDEADEMLDMGFRDDIETLMKSVPETRQTIFFSATMAPPIRRLIDHHTKDAVTITIEHKALTVPTVEQRYYEVQGRSKVEVLCRVIDIESPRLTIVFANTKRAVDDLTDGLVARGYMADRLHGDLSQMMRDRVMKNFRKASVEILVATDVAARGLDVDDVDLIFNFDLPYDEEDYVHRIGRTGRAGRSGKAVSLLAGKELYRLHRIERYTQSKVERFKIPSQEDVEDKRRDQFFESLKEVLEKKEFEESDRTVQRLLEAGFSSTDIASAVLHYHRKSSSRQGEEIQEDRPGGGKFKKTRGRERGGFDREGGRDRDRAPRERRPRASSESSGDHVRLFINVGRMDKVGPADIAGVIYNTAELPHGSVGSIDIFDKSSYVEVPKEHEQKVIDSVSGSVLRGRDLRMDQADRQDRPERQSNRSDRPKSRPPFKKKPYGGPRKGDDDFKPKFRGKGKFFKKKGGGGGGGGRFERD